MTRRGLLGQALQIGAGASLLSMGFPMMPSAGAAGLAGPLTVHCLCPTWCREGDIAVFEKAKDVQVTRACWTSNLSTLTKLATGATAEWDVVAVHHAFLYPIIRRGLLHPLNMADIPNAAHLFPYFKRAKFADYEGKVYGVPYVWTYDSVVYNADHIPNVDSWGVLFDDKYAGKVALRDDAQNAIQLTALYLGHKDPSVLSAADLLEIKKFLISKKKNFRKLWTGYAEAMTLLRSGEVWALSGWRPMWWALAKEGMNMKYAIPKEKGIGAIHYYVMSKDTKLVKTGYAFIDWTLGPYWGAAVGRDEGYNATSELLLKDLTPKLQVELGYDRIAETLKDVLFLDYPLNLNDWVQTWTEVKAA
ncbi:MAG TPA: extracellular solute-binding protein [Alphaproteobacteria bacterium]|nr:extracellular solute-binding protein [Alphaproteobacteria bacterium]